MWKLQWGKFCHHLKHTLINLIINILSEYVGLRYLWYIQTISLEDINSKESTCNAGDAGNMGSAPGLRRSPGGKKGNPLQYSCLENPMDRGAWWLQSMESQRVVHNWGTEHTHRIENTGKDGVLDNISKETKGKKKREFSREKMRA